MAKLPQISGREMSRILVRLGFVLINQRGSHMKFVRHHQYGKEAIVIPNHKTLRKGTLHDLLKKLNINLNQLDKLR